MKHDLKLYILIAAIVIAVATPPVLCYLFIVIPNGKQAFNGSCSQLSDNHSQSESSNNRKSSDSDESENEISQDSPGESTPFVIVIDPGHGGYDPGKVSPDGIAEKDINLAISEKLKTSLSSNGFSVHMTRSNDSSLGQQSGSNRKSLHSSHRSRSHPRPGT